MSFHTENNWQNRRGFDTEISERFTENVALRDVVGFKKYRSVSVGIENGDLTI
jgi:hypothetical protein